MVQVDREEQLLLEEEADFRNEVDASPNSLYLGGVEEGVDSRLLNYENFHGCISSKYFFLYYKSLALIVFLKAKMDCLLLVIWGRFKFFHSDASNRLTNYISTLTDTHINIYHSIYITTYKKSIPSGNISFLYRRDDLKPGWESLPSTGIQGKRSSHH